jgi:hypothetical protein
MVIRRRLMLFIRKSLGFRKSVADVCVVAVNL